MRAHKPRLTNPEYGHVAHKNSRLGVISEKAAIGQLRQLAAEKQTERRPKRIAGNIADGSALQNLLTLLHLDGAYIDETTLGTDDAPDLGNNMPGAGSSRLLSPTNFWTLGALSDRTLTANRVYCAPIYIRGGVQIDALVCEVTTVLSGGVCMGIYDASPSGFPVNSQVQSATNTLGATGVKTLGITPWVCPASNWYNIALCSTTAMGVRGSSVGANLPSPRGQTVSAFTTSMMLIIQDLTAGWSSLPDPWTGASITGDTYIHMGARVL